MSSIPKGEYWFSFSRSSGSGGQNVNKVNSKATLHWDLANSSIGPEVLEGLYRKFGSYITDAGELQVTSQEERSQQANVEHCLARVERMIREAKKRPKPRKKTKPTRASVKKRLEGKHRRSEVKSLRRKVSD